VASAVDALAGYGYVGFSRLLFPRSFDSASLIAQVQFFFVSAPSSFTGFLKGARADCSASRLVMLAMGFFSLDSRFTDH